VGLARSDGLSDENDTFDEIESQRDERRRNRALAITNFPMCARIGSRPKCKSPPVLADRDQQKS
jgi:hypothetical protein